MYPEKTYEDGLAEGDLKVMQQSIQINTDRIGNHERRLRKIEKTFYALMGAAFLLTAISQAYGLYDMVR